LGYTYNLYTLLVSTPASEPSTTNTTMAANPEGASSSEAAEGAERHITFNVKASNNQNFNGLTFPASATIKDVKEKLATPELANIPADRIRLIYSGRVLKDPDTLSTCKPEIKDGYTIHMVKGADSNSRQNPASGSSATPAVPAVPALAAGQGQHNPLADLTGARYAGFHGLPNASMFGADGGVCFHLSLLSLLE
jgi:ubiquilin